MTNQPTDLKHKRYLDVQPTEMVGTFEYIPVMAEVIYSDDDGSPDFESPPYTYVGSTEVQWDDQTTVTLPDGRPVYMIEGGTTVVVEPDGRVAEVVVSITATAEYVRSERSPLFEMLVEEFAKLPTGAEREAALTEVKMFADAYFADAEKS